MCYPRLVWAGPMVICSKTCFVATRLARLHRKMLSSTCDESDLLNGCGMLSTSEHTGSRRSEETPKCASEDTPDELCRSRQNPKQNTLAKCSGARPKSGGKLHKFPIFENPKESKESIRKKVYKTQHAKLSQRNASAINQRIQGKADTVDIHGTARLQDRRQRHETLQSENN